MRNVSLADQKAGNLVGKMITVERSLSLTDDQLRALQARVYNQIVNAKDALSNRPRVHVYEPLGEVESIVFVFREILNYHIQNFKLFLATGKLGRFQRRLRGKAEFVAEFQDYWPICPHLLWDWHDKTHPTAVAYDNSRKLFVRHDFASYQQTIIDEIMNFCGGVDSETVLELGCGSGRNIIALHKANKSFQVYFGLDFSPVAIFSTIGNIQVELIGPGGTKKFNFIVGEFKKSGLIAKSVDIAYSVWSLPYGCIDSDNDMVLIADEMIRVTRKRILLIEPDLSQSRFGISPSKDCRFWDIDTFCAILESRGCKVSKKVLPIQFNWLVPIMIITVDVL